MKRKSIVFNALVCLFFILLVSINQPANAKEPQYGGKLSILLCPWGSIEPTGFEPVGGAYTVEYFTSFYMERLLGANFEATRSGGDTLALTAHGAFDPKYMQGYLAESWEIPDDKTMIFNLRKGIRWQNKPPVNGREFTADDVVFTFNHRKKHPKTGKRLDNIVSVNALDKYTVQFKLKQFSGDWDFYIGKGPICSIIPPELVDAGIGDWRNAVGTGPFMLTDYVKGSSLTFKKNPDYWRKTTINGKAYKTPFVDTLVVPIIPDKSTQIAALRTGAIDIINKVGWQQWDSLARTNPDLQKLEYPHGRCFQIWFRTDKKPFDDIRVRKALWKAVDRHAIGNSLYGGKYLEHHMPIASNSHFYTPLKKLPSEVKDLFVYNPEQAKKLLAEAGYPNGFDTNVVIKKGDVETMEFLSAYWSKIGVKTDIRVTESGAFWGMVGKKSYDQMIEHTMTAGYTVITLRDNIWGNYFNLSQLKDPDFSSGYEKMIRIRDSEKAIPLVKALNVQLQRNIPTFHLPGQYVANYWQPWVQNYYGENGTSYGCVSHLMSSTWVDSSKKK